jgi:hypothetical protein
MSGSFAMLESFAVQVAVVFLTAAQDTSAELAAPAVHSNARDFAFMTVQTWKNYHFGPRCPPLNAGAEWGRHAMGMLPETPPPP